MSGNGVSEYGSSSNRMLLATLVFCTFSIGPLAVLVSLFLYPIATEFGVEVGVMGQVNTFSSVAAVVFALAMGFLSVRFRHKSLLMIGLLLFAVSAVGCFFAPGFGAMLLAYSISGVGLAMINPMVNALVGDHFSFDIRARAVSLTVGAGALAYVLGPLVLDLLSDLGGWRFSLMGFIIPLLFVSLVLAFFGIPSISHTHETMASQSGLLSGFKEVSSCKSAWACLAGDTLRSASFAAVLYYGAAFFMQRFGASTDTATLIVLMAASCYTVGSLVSGRLVDKVGRKPFTAMTALLAGVFTVFFVYVPSFWASLLLNVAAAVSFGMVTAAAISLTLEQVPAYRGTMMSVDSAFVNLGYALGAAVGGMALLRFGYGGLGAALGLFGIVAATVFYLFAKDPTRM
jgi:predicted MFS family arabinose efflux permease